MKRIILFYVIVVVTCLGTVRANIDYSGLLSYDNGGITGLTLNNTNSWFASGTQLKWKVTDHEKAYTHIGTS